MSRHNLEEQNDDVEQLNPKIQINAEKPADANTLDVNVEIIADQVTGQIPTKQASQKTGNGEAPESEDQICDEQNNDSEPETQINNSENNEARKSKTDPHENNVELSKDQLIKQNEPTITNPLDIQNEQKENDSEPETKINNSPEKENKQENLPINENDWFYLDLNDQIQGPFSTKQMNKWNSKGKLFENMLIKRMNFQFNLQKEQQYLPFLFRDKGKTQEKKKEVDFAQVGNKHEDDFQNDEGDKLQAVEVEINAQTKQNVTNKDPQIQVQLQIPKNETIPKETQDVENPEAENNMAGKPKTNKANSYLFDDSFELPDITYEPAKQNQQQQGDHQTQDNYNAGVIANAQTSAYTYSTHNEQQQQQSKYHVNAQEKDKQQYSENNKSISYYRYDESRDESQSDSQQQQIEQSTSPQTESKKWSESQWAAYKDAVFKAIKQCFHIEFETLKEAIIHHRIQTVGGVKKDGDEYVLDDTIKPTKIHLKFKQIASDCNSTKNECNKQFFQLQQKVLDKWPEEKLTEIEARINELWIEIHEPDINIKKQIIQECIDLEFHPIQQVQYRYKQITNKIDNIFKKLK
ncbi:GYF_domain [Hexamita inflata]|uniref:GYF domain n=1 Tax=Hexamita inflata TaxID=28002 RepID=A0AA86QA09_9EUKA|nr:GYF domain [Hexamita inflata]